jgi:hypothetical protein
MERQSPGHEVPGLSSMLALALTDDPSVRALALYPKAGDPRPIARYPYHSELFDLLHIHGRGHGPSHKR